jgi:flavin reductase (DIM6/NTAB) family NADH-FMN oxidoreductase RutF
MRKSFGEKPILYPMPVLILATYDKDGTPNAMNAAWGGISEENEITVCVSDDHKTTENFLETGAFTVSVGTADTVEACDYVGIVSGNNEKNKPEKAGWHTEKSPLVNAPLIMELPLALECRVKSYDKETCRLIGEIVNVSADECILNEAGKIDIEKLRPITYDPVAHTYNIIGAPIARAFSCGKHLKNK